MDMKSAWKALDKIKDPKIRAYIENALQEQAEREKGCGYCNNERAFEIYFSGEKAGIAYLHKCSDGWGLFLQMDDGDTYYTNVVNCPMCGKRLK